MHMLYVRLSHIVTKTGLCERTAIVFSHESNFLLNGIFLEHSEIKTLLIFNHWLQVVRMCFHKFAN